jgi:hypothetical protein
MKNEMAVNRRTLEEVQDLIRFAQKTTGRSQETALEKAQTKCRMMLGMDTNFHPEFTPGERLIRVVMPARVYDQLNCASALPFPKEENISAHRLKALVDFNAFHRDIELSFELMPLTLTPDSFPTP